MKIKRKQPVFSAVVLRVIAKRFTEIEHVAHDSDNWFVLTLNKKVLPATFCQDFDRYMVQLVAEFGDRDTIYHFDVYKENRLQKQLRYNEINNISKCQASFSRYYGNL